MVVAAGGCTSSSVVASALVPRASLTHASNSLSPSGPNRQPQVFLTPSDICIAMEYASGGTMFDYVSDCTTPVAAADIATSIHPTLLHFHSHPSTNNLNEQPPPLHPPTHPTHPLIQPTHSSNPPTHPTHPPIPPIHPPTQPTHPTTAPARRPPPRARRPLVLPAAARRRRLLPPQGRRQPRHQAREHAAAGGAAAAAAARQDLRLWVLKVRGHLGGTVQGGDADLHGARGAGQHVEGLDVRRQDGGRLVVRGDAVCDAVRVLPVWVVQRPVW